MTTLLPSYESKTDIKNEPKFEILNESDLLNGDPILYEIELTKNKDNSNEASHIIEKTINWNILKSGYSNFLIILKIKIVI